MKDLLSRPGPALGGLGLLVASVSAAFAFVPDLQDYRTPGLALGLILGLLGGAAFRLRREDLPRGPAALVVGLSLLVSLAIFSWYGVAFARQVRAQWGWTDDRKREAWMTWQVGLRWEELEEARRRIPEDAGVLLLWNPEVNRFAQSLVIYYLHPRKLYWWSSGPPFQVVDGRPVVLPEEAWLRDHDISWALVLYGELGNRVRLVPLEELPRP